MKVAPQDGHPKVTGNDGGDDVVVGICIDGGSGLVIAQRHQRVPVEWQRCQQGRKGCVCVKIGMSGGRTSLVNAKRP